MECKCYDVSYSDPKNRYEYDVFNSSYFQDILLSILFILHWFGAMIGFLVSGTVIWPAFRKESSNAELGVNVDWSTIESASVAAGVGCVIINYYSDASTC